MVATKANKSDGITVTIDGVTVSQTLKIFILLMKTGSKRGNTISIGVKRLLEEHGIVYKRMRSLYAKQYGHKT